MGKPYERNRDGARLVFKGMNTMMPPDRMPPGKYPFAQNVRAILGDRVMDRPPLGNPVETLPAAVHSLRRLNDSTPAGPVAGFILVGGASTILYAGNTPVATGLSGNPLSLLPFRPNASVQPWMYVGDSVRMLKVRSDGLCYKMGIAEPQATPVITAVPASDQVSLVGPVTVTYWGDSPHNSQISNYIWKNASDPGGAGPVRISTPPSGVTTGNSLLFDVIPGAQETPVAWTQYTEYQGVVDTVGTLVTWDSGDQFEGLAAGNAIVITGITYTVATIPAPTNTSLSLTTSAGNQSGASFSAAAITGTTPLFAPALESEGYSDFNFAVQATLYIPVAGSYTISLLSKDEVIWGIGSNGTGKATWPGPSGGQVLALTGQTKTALSGYPLMPKTVTDDGGGQHDTASIVVTFTAAGNYPIEIDYDYYFHSGRTLQITCNGQNIAPLPGSVITNAQYRYVYRSSATGALSNPSPASAESALSVLVNKVVAVPSTDPQVDKIDFYRLDSALGNYTYVGTGPNSAAPFTDSLLDVDIAANPILEFDNFEPFPSIDLPAAGVVTVTAGVVVWTSGTRFNIRWLPGTIIVIGTVAYTLNRRPTDDTHLTATNVTSVGGIEVESPPPNGTGLIYTIQEPDLAAQPLPYIWGPTDNINFAFGCGDPLRPGVLYWCKGGNLDSAPDTNQEDVTSPSEPLQNGALTNGIGVVFSTERGWLILPNFFNALATVQGTTGSTWTLQEGSFGRGLYIPRALAIDGSRNIFWRGKDGVYKSAGGGSEKSITDGDLFNLFPHEGSTPTPITRGGFTVYPPDDSQPQMQKMSVANGYLYYDYVDLTNVPRTMVFDIAADGWVWDVYQFLATVHMLEEGVVNGTLVGCQDGSVRPFQTGGPEVATAIILMPSETGGDVRATKHWADTYIEGETVS